MSTAKTPKDFAKELLVRWYAPLADIEDSSYRKSEGLSLPEAMSLLLDMKKNPVEEYLDVLEVMHNILGQAIENIRKEVRK